MGAAWLDRALGGSCCRRGLGVIGAAPRCVSRRSASAVWAACWWGWWGRGVNGARCDGQAATPVVRCTGVLSLLSLCALLSGSVVGLPLVIHAAFWVLPLFVCFVAPIAALPVHRAFHLTGLCLDFAALPCGHAYCVGSVSRSRRRCHLLAARTGPRLAGSAVARFARSQPDGRYAPARVLLSLVLCVSGYASGQVCRVCRCWVLLFALLLAVLLGVGSHGIELCGWCVGPAVSGAIAGSAACLVSSALLPSSLPVRVRPDQALLLVLACV